MAQMHHTHLSGPDGQAVIETADAPNTISTPYLIGPGDTFSGQIDPGDTDWVAVSLVGGTTYTITLQGSGTAPLDDTYLVLYDTRGQFIDFDDDGGPGRGSELVFTPSQSGIYYLDAQAWDLVSGSGSYTLSVTIGAPPGPVAGSVQDMALYLTDGYWLESGENPHSFAAASGAATTQITVNLSSLTPEGQQLARWAMQSWEAVAAITFVEVSGPAQIRFTDNQTGAFADHSDDGLGNTLRVTVNVGTEWLDIYGTEIDSYSYQTYVHEIGHALGLGHQGDYNGFGDFEDDAAFTLDSWQLSIMSYFAQDENPNVTGSFAYAVTPMTVDILAVQMLYGAPAGGETAGDTVYGVGHTLTGPLGVLFDGVFGSTAPGVTEGNAISFTLYDEGGFDTLDLSLDTFNQTVDLRSGSISSVIGLTGNMILMPGTRIEVFEAGSGSDDITGNVQTNTISGNNGRDTVMALDGDDLIFGGAGSDDLMGNAASDTLYGGGGNDMLSGGLAGDTLYGGGDADTLTGQAGDDRLQGDAGNDDLNGNAGNDAVIGNGGDDRLRGGLGDDSLNGADGNDTLWGNEGDDILNAGAGDDLLYGSTGNDRLSGGAGDDTMTGGAGADVFLFTEGDDVITDFALAEDQLHLDDALWGGTALGTADILALATVSGTDILFSFDGGHSLRIEGVTDLGALGDALTVF